MAVCATCLNASRPRDVCFCIGSHDTAQTFTTEFSANSQLATRRSVVDKVEPIVRSEIQIFASSVLKNTG